MIKLNKTTYKLTPKDNPKDRIEITVGDKDEADFSPKLKIARWDDEVNLVITPKNLDKIATKDKKLKLEGDKIKLETPKIDYHLYEMPISEANPEGAFEFEVILKEKPDTNKVEFSLDTKGLDFHYQPPLTEQMDEHIAEFGNDIEVSETEVTKDGEVVRYRPEKVVGSYAVYTSENKVNYVGGKEYKTGQVGMIYRPRICDSNNWCVWEELKIENRILTITIPQDFLDKAFYPIKSKGINFGYETKGSSSTSLQANQAPILLATGAAGTGDSMSVAVQTFATAGQYTLALYKASDKSFVQKCSEHSIPANTPGTYQGAFYTDNFVSSPNLTAIDYHLVIFSKIAGAPNIYYNSGGGGNTSGLGNPFGTYATFPNPHKITINGTTRYSIYATYTAASSGPANLKSYNGVLKANIKSINGLAIADIKSINGLE